MQAQQDIVYGTEDPKQKWDLYTPTSMGEGKAKGVIVFVHGGAWKAGDKSFLKPLAQNLINLTGMPIAIPNYRLSPSTPDGPELKHPKHAEDIVLALISIKSSELVTSIADTNNIYLVGHSCGCHMISTIMLDPPTGEGVLLSSPLPANVQDSIKAVVHVGAFYDLDRTLALNPEYREWVELAMPTTPDGSFSQFAVDRYTVRKGTAIPWLLIYSNGDTAVKVDQVEGMKQHLESEYERLGYDPKLIRQEVADLGDHIGLLNNLDYAKLVASVV